LCTLSSSSTILNPPFFFLLVVRRGDPDCAATPPVRDAEADADGGARERQLVFACLQWPFASLTV
jgi:hypothetical protein